MMKKCYVNFFRINRQLHKIILAIHQNYPGGLSNSDILRSIGFRPIQANGSNQHKSFFFFWFMGINEDINTAWIGRKDYDKSPKYSIMSKGLQLSNDLFDQIAPRAND